MKRRVFGWILTVFLLLCPGGVRTEPDLSVRDGTVRTGPWTEAYAAILSERSAGIQAYRDYAASVIGLPDCRPVGLTDLTGNGIPDLLFLDLVDDTEYGYTVGRLWIYICDGSGVHCALTLQPETDDLLYSRFYLSKTGTLTLRFSDTEQGWILRLHLSPKGVYEADTVLTDASDLSGEGPDYYYLNGKEISSGTFQSLTAQVLAGLGSMIGSLMADDGGSGFAYTVTEALDALASGKMGRSDGQAAPAVPGELPEPVFIEGSFAAGQRSAVCSAPSEWSRRGPRAGRPYPPAAGFLRPEPRTAVS